MRRPRFAENTSISRIGPAEGLTPNPKAPLRQQVHEVMRFYHYAARTETAYWQWIVRFLRHWRGRPLLSPAQPAPVSAVPRTDGWHHPREMGAAEVSAFLTHLATAHHVSGSTQNQALNALVFLYDQVLHQPLGELEEFARVRRLPRIREVLSPSEVNRLFEAMDPTYALPLKLLYGTGLRLMVA